MNRRLGKQLPIATVINPHTGSCLCIHSNSLNALQCDYLRLLETGNEINAFSSILDSEYPLQVLREVKLYLL